MISHLHLRRCFLHNQRGFSTIIATIFMVLAVLFLFFNVYIFMQKQDVKFQDTVIQSQQMDADRNNEKLSISTTPTQTINGNTITVNCTIKNDGSIPAKIVRAWLTDTTTKNAFSHTTILEGERAIILTPGQSSNTTLFFTMTPSGQFRLDLVTSRGNIVTRTLP